jgi:hypothetical protein
MSGRQPPRPPAPKIGKGTKMGAKVNKSELKRRVDFVADVLRRVYVNNRRDVRVVNLPVTARDELQQQALREYLRQPENTQLLNNIYDARMGVTGGSAANLAMQINPIVYPQIFAPRTGTLQQPLLAPARTEEEERRSSEARQQEVQQELDRAVAEARLVGLPALEVQRTEEEERPAP